MVQKSDDVVSFGEHIGHKLAGAKASMANPVMAVRTFVDAVLAAHPGVKLPELVGDSEVRAWLEARSVGDGQLRHALTEARRALRGKPAITRARKPAVRAPIVDAIKPPRARSPAELAAGAVQNRPLADL